MVRRVVGALAGAMLAAGPLAAQDNNSAAAPPPASPPASSSTIGPGELSNFSLPGTVTRPADRPARPADRPARTTTATPPATTAPAPTTTAPTRTSRTDRPATTAAPATRPATTDSDLFRRPPTLPDSKAAPGIAQVAPVIDEPVAEAAPAPAGGSSSLPWIIGLLVIAGGGAAWFALRRRGGERYAAAGPAPIDIVSPLAADPRPVPPPAAAPRPDPTPASTVPPPAPAPARKPLPTTLMPPAPGARTGVPRPDPIVPAGIVSTGLRPWIEVELAPDRALIDDNGAAIAFEVTLYNSGSAAARDVVIEAKLLNAGASQDTELSAFFTAEASVSDPIPQIAPYARIPLRSAVRLPREGISEYDYEGRKLFMPMVAISVRYRWSSGSGQSAFGFLVGQGAEGQERLAPLRIDRGSRSWNGLGARRYEKGVRR